MTLLLNTTPATPVRWHTVMPVDLPPYLEQNIADWLKQSAQNVAWLTEMYGSPLNVVWPHTVAQNLAAMTAATARFGIRARFFYGVKVNQSQALLQAAAAAGAGADISSLQELQDALRTGLRGDRLCATGPAKTPDFLHELMLHNVQIVVDSPQELNDIMTLTARWLPPSGSVRLLLRLRPEASAHGRFGLTSGEITRALEDIAACPRVQFVGFHFHLSGYAAHSRISAFFDLLPLLEKSRSLGLRPNTIDIGGGLPVQYLASDRYRAWIAGQQPADYHNANVPTGFYPYGGETNAEQWLTQFLEGQDPQGRRVADVLREEELTLCVEPGRSLVDQSAVTIFRVVRTRPQPDGHHVIFVEGSSFSACETWFNSEFLIDPIHVRCANDAQPAPFGQAWIAGHSCLDEDVIAHRLVRFRHLPQPGDLLVFANTAGYQMDLLENRFHRHPLPTRLVAWHTPLRRLAFSLDE
ncbi:Y4yA family PLP-dependent enzyme [Budvicia diplopodorum]|uniref:Y4yA family PLP-dependent enzyme n=1 Tax=Budvicia diplopodorum TaxID=1119056 RepID=UPI0013569B5F|nr:Y4yA family PLP-dependent enzyme [Budvicia diplopodorum]